MEYLYLSRSQNTLLRKKTSPVKSGFKKVISYGLGFATVLIFLNAGEASLTLESLSRGVTKDEMQRVENDFYKQPHSGLEKEISIFFQTLVTPGREFAYWRYDRLQNDR